MPEQIAADGLAAILTLTGKIGFTVIVIEFDVAGEPVAQVEFEVRTHVIISLLFNVVEENVPAFVPAFTPLTFHW